MNGAHIHLIVNHVPVFLVPVALALLAFAIIRKSADVTNASLALFVLSAVIGGAVLVTGDPAERVVEHLPGISRAAIKAHEEAADTAAIVTGLAGLLGFWGLVVSRGGRSTPTWLLAATLAVGLVAAGLMARAANLGGFIRHSEIADTSPLGGSRVNARADS